MKKKHVLIFYCVCIPKSEPPPHYTLLSIPNASSNIVSLLTMIRWIVQNREEGFRWSFMVVPWSWIWKDLTCIVTSSPLWLSFDGSLYRNIGKSFLKILFNCAIIDLKGNWHFLWFSYWHVCQMLGHRGRKIVQKDAHPRYIIFKCYARRYVIFECYARRIFMGKANKH
jgi:hypothetical protein